MDILTFVNVLLLLANLAVFALALKLYTEFFKENAQRKRAAAKDSCPTNPPEGAASIGGGSGS